MLLVMARVTRPKTEHASGEESPKVSSRRSLSRKNKHSYAYCKNENNIRNTLCSVPLAQTKPAIAIVVFVALKHVLFQQSLSIKDKQISHKAKVSIFWFLCQQRLLAMLLFNYLIIWLLDCKVYCIRTDHYGVYLYEYVV